MQDYILRVYGARLALGQIGFEEWIRHEYRANPLQEGWEARQPEAEVAQRLMTERDA